MREIKFRAWKKSANRMLDWAELCAMPRLCNVLNGEYLEAVMQYTSLHDKNGKEIWAGDILVFRNNKSIYRKGEYDSFSQVCFGDYAYGEYEQAESGYGWFLKGITDEDGSGLNQHFADYHEVIGNIYENPELLK